MSPLRLRRGHAGYPRELEELENPPPMLTTSGPLVMKRAIAIVGSREAVPDALRYAHDLAFQLASAGILIISGGAIGIDGAAHRGAMAAGGATWVVSPTGKDRLYPSQHRQLFDEVAASKESRMLWSFDDNSIGIAHNMRYRNGVIAALCETLVVVQAHFRSGSRNAMSWARDMNRPVWAVTAFPWVGAFCGSQDEIGKRQAQPLCSTSLFFKELGLAAPIAPPPVDLATLHSAAPRTEEELQNDGPASKSTPLIKGPPKPPDTSLWSEHEKLIFSVLSLRAVHIDKIVEQTHLSVPPVATALLTLCLKDVVVEGPDGFFRRKKAG